MYLDLAESPHHYAAFLARVGYDAALLLHGCFNGSSTPELFRFHYTGTATSMDYQMVNSALGALSSKVTVGNDCKFLLLLSDQWLVNSLNDEDNLFLDDLSSLPFDLILPSWIPAVHGDLELSKKSEAIQALNALRSKADDRFVISISYADSRKNEAYAAISRNSGCLGRAGFSEPFGYLDAIGRPIPMPSLALAPDSPVTVWDPTEAEIAAIGVTDSPSALVTMQLTQTASPPPGYLSENLGVLSATLFPVTSMDELESAFTRGEAKIIAQNQKRLPGAWTTEQQHFYFAMQAIDFLSGVLRTAWARGRIFARVSLALEDAALVSCLTDPTAAAPTSENAKTYLATMLTNIAVLDAEKSALMGAAPLSFTVLAT